MSDYVVKTGNIDAGSDSPGLARVDLKDNWDAIGKISEEGTASAVVKTDISGNIVATGVFKIGSNDINAAGILSNVAYKNQDNNFTIGQTITGNLGVIGIVTTSKNVVINGDNSSYDLTINNVGSIGSVAKMRFNSSNAGVAGGGVITDIHNESDGATDYAKIRFNMRRGSSWNNVVFHSDGSIVAGGKITSGATGFSMNGANGVSGSFTTVDSKTVTVTLGIITSIV